MGGGGREGKCEGEGSAEGRREGAAPRGSVRGSAGAVGSRRTGRPGRRRRRRSAGSDEARRRGRGAGSGAGLLTCCCRRRRAAGAACRSLGTRRARPGGLSRRRRPRAGTVRLEQRERGARARTSGRRGALRALSGGGGARRLKAARGPHLAAPPSPRPPPAQLTHEAAGARGAEGRRGGRGALRRARLAVLTPHQRPGRSELTGDLRDWGSSTGLIFLQMPWLCSPRISGQGRAPDLHSSSEEKQKAGPGPGALTLEDPLHTHPPQV